MTLTPGRTVTLGSQWYEWAGGPLADLDAPPALSVIPAAGGDPVHGPTTGAHPAVGIYTSTWHIPLDLAAGAYLAIWEGEHDEAARQAVELLIVGG